MTAGISNEGCIRELLWNAVEPLTRAVDTYGESVRDLESKRNEVIPRTKNPAFQSEVNKTHALYMQHIEMAIINLKAQIAIGKEIKELFARRDIGFGKLSASLGKIQSRLTPLQTQLNINKDEIKKLEDKIIDLIS